MLRIVAWNWSLFAYTVFEEYNTITYPIGFQTLNTKAFINDTAHTIDDAYNGWWTPLSQTAESCIEGYAPRAVVSFDGLDLFEYAGGSGIWHIPAGLSDDAVGLPDFRWIGGV